MKKIINVLALVMVGMLASCNTDPGPDYYNNVPAIVHYDNSQQLFIKTSYGLFAAPELAGKYFIEGQCLWTSFIVDPDNQPSEGITTASSMQYIEVDHTAAEKVESLIDSYMDPIDDAVLYALTVGNTLFFGFEHQAPKGQIYDYEIIFNEEKVIDEDGVKTPILYIKALKRNVPSETTITTVGEFYAFDMTVLLDYMKAQNPTIGKIKLYLEYKTGVDTEGNDVYKKFHDYPVTWPLY